MVLLTSAAKRLWSQRSIQITVFAQVSLLNRMFSDVRIMAAAKNGAFIIPIPGVKPLEFRCQRLDKTSPHEDQRRVVPSHGEVSDVPLSSLPYRIIFHPSVEVCVIVAL